MDATDTMKDGQDKKHYDGCERYDGQKARRARSTKIQDTLTTVQSNTNFTTKANDRCLRRMRTTRWKMEKKHEDPRHVNDGPNTNLRRKRTTRVYDGYIIEESSSREINMLRLAQPSTERPNAQESPAQKGPRHAYDGCDKTHTEVRPRQYTR